jgi:hypothetical protein
MLATEGGGTTNDDTGADELAHAVSFHQVVNDSLGSQRTQVSRVRWSQERSRFAWSGLHERGVFCCGKLLSDLFHFMPPEVLRTNGPRTLEAAALAAFLNRPQAVAQIGGGALFCAPKQKTRSVLAR